MIQEGGKNIKDENNEQRKNWRANTEEMEVAERGGRLRTHSNGA